MTSNLGAGEVDFRTAETDELRTLAERFMRRELVNRISGVIGFRPLEGKHLAKILDQILAAKAGMFEAEKGLIIEVDQSARRLLAARPGCWKTWAAAMALTSASFKPRADFRNLPRSRRDTFFAWGLRACGWTVSGTIAL